MPNIFHTTPFGVAPIFIGKHYLICFVFLFCFTGVILAFCTSDQIAMQPVVNSFNRIISFQLFERTKLKMLGILDF